MNHRSRTWELEVAAEHVDGGIVLVPRGRIGSVTAPVFKEAINAALTTAPRIIVDLTDVDYVSGAGVHALQQAAAANGARIILCGLRDAVRITLELGGVLDGALVVKNRPAALESLIGDH